MKKVALITHSFHEKTRSAEVYMNEIFEEKDLYKFEIFYNHEWRGAEEKYLFNTVIKDFDAVIIAQIISKNILDHIHCENIIFMPMYDSMLDFSYKKKELWLLLAGLKIISPTKKMSELLRNNGLDSFNIKYFPETNNYSVPNFKKIFFWNRVESINFDIVIKLIKNFKYSNLNIHKKFDPGQEPILPTKNQVKEYKVTYTDWFKDREEYLVELSKYGLFIAPRPFEGTGIASFMDALKRGMIVIAPNNSPYDEYIVNHENGILYDLNNPEKIDFTKLDLNQISRNAFKSVDKGRKDWKDSRESLLNYIFEYKHFPNSLIYKNNLNMIINDKWYLFGMLNRSQKFKSIFKFLFLL